MLLFHAVLMICSAFVFEAIAGVSTLTSHAWQHIVYTAQPPITVSNMDKAYTTLIAAADSVQKHTSHITDTLAHSTTADMSTSNYAHVQMYTQNSMECEHDVRQDVTV